MIFPSLFTSILNQTCPAMTDALFASKGTSLTYFKIKKKNIQEVINVKHHW